MQLENMSKYRLQEIINRSKGLFDFECYYFECYEGKLYAGGSSDFRTIEKGFRADYCINQGKFYQL